jgi:hypothetical protein
MSPTLRHSRGNHKWPRDVLLEPSGVPGVHHIQMRNFISVNMQGGWMTRGVASNTVWNQYLANGDRLSCTALPRLVRREFLGMKASCPVEYNLAGGHSQAPPGW